MTPIDQLRHATKTNSHCMTPDGQTLHMDALLAEIEEMQAKLRDAEETLRWYADEDKYSDQETDHEWTVLKDCSAVNDRGQRARDCLNGLTKEKKDD